eukprot:TRINITY_DN4236_c0_g1_i1.p1 TRINITY_DN4236_c0_g1~~TRINITY_DN4236_c0_g1_i1.p1  ORF type:complete len:219 (-),score=24.79 TRINITY_DN4236_c0_g1_i1:586-1242(-)
MRSTARLSSRAKAPFGVKRARTALCQASKEKIQSLKKDLFDMVGDKGGLDQSQATKQAVAQHVLKFQGMGPQNPEQQDLSGTEWRTLWTDSEGSSAGKIGPFVGTGGQVFPADKPGQYINSLDLFGGVLRLELTGVYEAAPDSKIELEFKFVKAFLAGLQVQKRDFPAGYKGFWKMLYADDSLRIFNTNKESLFVMYNQEAGKTVYTNWERFDKATFG